MKILFTFITFILVIIGVFYLFAGNLFPQSNDGIPEQRFAVIDKSFLKASSMDHPSKKTALGNPQKVNLEEKYFFICLGEVDRKQHIFQVDKSTYQAVSINTIFDYMTMSLLPYYSELPIENSEQLGLVTTMAEMNDHPPIFSLANIKKSIQTLFQ